MNDKKIIYIASFLVSVILMNNIAGNEATYKYLVLVLIGVVFYNFNKYNIKITTPEIMGDSKNYKEETSGAGGGGAGAF